MNIQLTEVIGVRHLIATIGTSIIILIICQSYAVADAENANTAPPPSAITDASSAITALEKQSGPFSASLFEPLMSLARLHIEEGQVEAAENVLRRAQNINHRNEGVYSPGQLETVGLLAELAMQEQAFATANQLHEFAFFVSTHHIGLDHPDSLYAYADLARWYLGTGQARRAKNLLLDAIALADKHGRESLQFATMIIQAQRLYGLCCSNDDLLDALQSSTAAGDLRTVGLLTLADSYILSRKPELAAEYYSKAFAASPIMASSQPLPITIKHRIHRSQADTLQIYKVRPKYSFVDPGALERLSAAELLDDPSQPPQWFILDAEQKHLSFKTPDSYNNFSRGDGIHRVTGSPFKFSLKQLNTILPHSQRTDAARENLSIRFSFTVAATGNLQDIKVTESNAAPALSRLIVRALKRVYFRPGLDQGQPIDTEGVVLVQTFLPDSR